MSRRRWFVVACVAALPLGVFAGQAVTLPNTGGEEIPGDPGPAVALYDELGIECSGALIGPKVVLTAAHCMAHPDKDGHLQMYPRMFARAGKVDRTAGQRRNVARVDLPESWTGEKGPDLAVVHLDGPMVGVQVARLGPVDRARVVRVLGWGMIENLASPASKQTPPTQLRALTMHVVDGSRCLDVQPDELCVAPPGAGPWGLFPPETGTCYGDSGGGGYQGITVVFILSRGTADTAEGGGGKPPCVPGNTAGASVGAYLGWIHSAMAKAA